MVMAMGLYDSEVTPLRLFRYSWWFGLDQLSSVSQAKYHDITAQYAYNVDFDLPSAPKSPVASGYGMD